ncbi:MAG TPA: MFS transporter [Candidatus Limnocylindrales bacterium]|nr:MFS transporter [Candidatus Limnocylindrales bacterium]
MTTAALPAHDPPGDEPLRRNRDFATLLVSQSVSAGGDAVSATALPLLVLALTGSGLVMGVVGAINTGADFVFGTIAGAIADRGDRKRMMFVADLGRAILTATIPLSVLLGGPTMAVILIVSGPMAILRGFFRAGYLASMPNLVGRSQLARGNGILETAYSASFIVGPAVAGFLVTIIGPGETLAIDAASFAISSVGLVLIRRELKAPPDRPPSRIVDDIREGIDYVVHHAVLRTVILLFAVTTAVLTPVAAAMTFRVVRDLGQSPAAFGLTLTGLGAGTMLGAIFASRLGPGTNVARVALAAVAVMGVPLIVAAIVPSLPAIVALTGLSGAGEAALVVIYVSVRAANSPDALVGRIASTARVMALGLMPIGSLAGGVLIDTVGGSATLAILGAAMCVLALAFSRVGGLRSASLAPRPSQPGVAAPLSPAAVPAQLAGTEPAESGDRS